MYSIFSVREEVLKAKAELPNKIASEEVGVRLRIMIKKDREMGAFLQELWEILFKDEMQKLLSCYSMGSLLTHTNEQFGKAVYNIETEILIKGAYIEHGKAMDNGENNKAETTS